MHVPSIAAIRPLAVRRDSPSVESKVRRAPRSSLTASDIPICRVQPTIAVIYLLTH
jgi:hypothetical protein